MDTADEEHGELKATVVTTLQRSTSVRSNNSEETRGEHLKNSSSFSVDGESTGAADCQVHSQSATSSTVEHESSLSQSNSSKIMRESTLEHTSSVPPKFHRSRPQFRRCHRRLIGPDRSNVSSVAPTKPPDHPLRGQAPHKSRYISHW